MTFEPSLALRTAIRGALIASPAVTALVPADQVRAWSARPERTCILLAGEQTIYLGRAAGGFHVARTWCDVHVFAPEAEGDLAHEIVGAAMAVLFDAPPAEGFTIDEWQRPSIRWQRQASPAWQHGHGEIEAVIRWRPA